MKYYIIHITYVVPLERIQELTPSHREHLAEYYRRGLLLFSGPRVPRTGGILVARAESEDAINAMIDADPYKLNQAALYEVIEMNPVLWAEDLNKIFGTP